MFNISEYILMIVEQGTFSSAAEQLHLSQPALSIAVKKLEVELGYPIFERHNNPLKLTIAGEIYVEKARKIQMLNTELGDELADLSHNIIGTINLGGAFISVNYLLPRLLKEFHHEYPLIQINLQEAPFPELTNMMLQGKLDLSVDTDWFLHPNIESIQIFENHILLAVPDQFIKTEIINKFGYSCGEVFKNAHLRDFRPRVPLRNFANIPYVLMTPSNEIFQRTKSYFTDAHFAPKSAITVNQQASTYEFVKQKWGAGFISDTLVQFSPSIVDVHFYRIDSVEQPRFVAISYNRKMYLSRAKQAFIDFTTNFYKQKGDS